jgi:hypothetical protein
MARGHQNLIWTRNRQTNALRSALREYYPAALEAFPDLADRDSLAVLAKAPAPAAGASLTLGQIQAALKRGGRQRNIERRAGEIQTALRTGQLAAPPAVADAFAATTLAAVGIIAELNRQISQLEATLTASFEQHPDSDIYHSLPGFGVVLGARALGEFGDDPNRYATSKVSPKLRRHVTIDDRVREEEGRSRPTRPQPAPLRRTRSGRVLRAHPKPRMPPLLRPAPNQRRSPSSGPTRARQPPRQHPSRLARASQPLRREHRLGPPPTRTRARTTSRLTPRAPGVSNLQVATNAVRKGLGVWHCSAADGYPETVWALELPEVCSPLAAVKAD